MKENHIVVNRTARFFTEGTLGENTKRIWLVVHGFGYLAADFLKSFEELFTEDDFFIAPEALNHFYLKAGRDKVGATWMTREDRLNEIKDYCNYLDDLYALFELERYPQAEIIALGFSQGASTVTRWASHTDFKIDKLVVYAGEVAPELLPLAPHSHLLKSENYFVFGNNDEYFSLELLEQMNEAYEALRLTTVRFEGKHEINIDALRKIVG